VPPSSRWHEHPWSALGPHGIGNRWASAGTSGHGRRVGIAGHRPSTATTSDEEAALDRVRTPQAARLLLPWDVADIAGTTAHRKQGMNGYASAPMSTVAPQPNTQSLILAVDHPTAAAFLDESGVISQDRFFLVGCLKLSEPSLLVRRLQRLRDREQWYNELHWFTLTRKHLPLYKKVIDATATCPGLKFSCFVTDRTVADPVGRFGSAWKAYEKLATQLLLGNIQPTELVTVLADYFSTPNQVNFEMDVRSEVN
jgi:hypothetical protein